MESTINERIALIISEFKYKSKRSFAERIGLAQTSLNDVLRGAEPKFSTLNKILKAEPLISPEWLLTGDGPMLKDNATSNVDAVRLENEIKLLRDELKDCYKEIGRLEGENRMLREHTVVEVKRNGKTA